MILIFRLFWVFFFLLPTETQRSLNEAHLPFELYKRLIFKKQGAGGILLMAVKRLVGFFSHCTLEKGCAHSERSPLTEHWRLGEQTRMRGRQEVSLTESSPEARLLAEARV